uniref:Uncharacterized protein n=1 Tax=Tribolium castaneum TaxID=7070 RepID=A5I8K6_TRICA|nr:hypothetical protein [Tribolium castaneum]
MKSSISAGQGRRIGIISGGRGQNTQRVQNQPLVIGCDEKHVSPHVIGGITSGGPIPTKSSKYPIKRKRVRFQTRVKVQEGSKSGRNKWFFQKGRF